MADSWVVLFGNAKVADGVISLTPTPAPEETRKGTPADGVSAASGPPYSYVRSNIEFEQGTITWEAKLTEPTGRAQIFI